MMKKEKKSYEAPTLNVLDLLVEGMVCTSPGVTINNWQDDGDPLSM